MKPSFDPLTVLSQSITLPVLEIVAKNPKFTTELSVVNLTSMRELLDATVIGVLTFVPLNLSILWVALIDHPS